MPKPHSEARRAAVVSALLLGQSVTEVAKQFKLSTKTVRDWQLRAGIAPPEVELEKTKAIGDLVITYLRRSLTTLEAQAEQFSNREWLAKQDAADAAVLHGVMADKAVRILEALDSGSDDGAKPEIQTDVSR